MYIPDELESKAPHAPHLTILISNYSVSTCLGHIQRLSLRSKLDETFAQSFTINHPGCRIPKQLLHGPTVDPYYSNIGDLYCDNRTSSQPRPRLILDGYDFIYLNRSALQYYGVQDVVCGYRSFQRVDGPADAVK